MSIPTGAVSRWPLNGDANDVIGSNDLTLNNSPSFVSSSSPVGGQALSFDGINQYANKNSPAGFPTGGDAFTIAGWVKFDSLPPPDYLPVWSYGTNNSNQSTTLYAKKNESKAFINWQGGGGDVEHSVSQSTWYHIVQVFEGNTSGQNHLYIDKVLRDTGSKSNSNLGNNKFILSGELGSSSHYECTLQEVIVWDRDLSSTEVEELYDHYIVTPINYFNQSTATYGQAVTSTINKSSLVSKIQAAGTDTYFDSTSELYSVTVRYTHEDSRQRRVILHSGSGLTGSVSWLVGARDGTWQKDLVEAHDANAARAFLLRADIGTDEDIVMSDGTMTLNT